MQRILYQHQAFLLEQEKKVPWRLIMSQYQRLLLIINPASRHSLAINHAGALAKASGASLHIAALAQPVEVLLLLEDHAREKARNSYLQDHTEWLQAQCKNLRGRGVEVTTEVAWVDDLQQDILDHVTEMQPDLLIKAVQREPAFKRAFFTPLDWRLLRHCPVPMYLVGGGGHSLPRKIVAAVDASGTETAKVELNERIIQQASSLALQCEADLHLLYACDISAVYTAEMESYSLADLTKALRRTEEKSFLELATHYGVPSDRHHFMLGHPVEVLSEFASEYEMDVIVMGRVQYRGLEKLLGSTTEHILYQADCDVLAV